MSFNMATLYAPLILISLLYLPTIIYTIFLGVNFHGWKNCIFQTLNNPVYFIFPIMTCMSFYGRQKKVHVEEKSETSAEKESIKMYFSIKQSNILYMLFLLGSALCLFGDLYMQTKRGTKEHQVQKYRVSLLGSSLSPLSMTLWVILLINILLWFDFTIVANSAGDTQGTQCYLLKVI